MVKANRCNVDLIVWALSFGNHCFQLPLIGDLPALEVSKDHFVRTPGLGQGRQSSLVVVERCQTGGGAGVKVDDSSSFTAPRPYRNPYLNIWRCWVVSWWLRLGVLWKVQAYSYRQVRIKNVFFSSEELPPPTIRFFQPTNESSSWVGVEMEKNGDYTLEDVEPKNHPN